MKLVLDGHSLEYEMRALCFTFFPGKPVECINPTSDEKVSGDFVYTRIRQYGHTKVHALVCVSKDGKRICAGERFRTSNKTDGHTFDRQCEFALGRAMYSAATKLTKVSPPWGILTGIRPVKLARERLSAGLSRQETVEALHRCFLTSKEKAELCVESAIMEEKIVSLSQPNSASLYVSIPFCPSRCLYCSFISHDVKNSAKLLPEYIQLMCEEIKNTGEIADKLGLKLETIYIGGGTPTSLTAEQLYTIMSCIKKSFNMDNLREYTVEAGRPDTITRAKLNAIAECGAERISINPQTLDDDILRAIGRNHTSQQFFEAFKAAREIGIPSINTDLIAGLPGDTPEGFAKTLDGVLSLEPEAVTVHTLAMKRSSRLVTSGGGIYDAAAEDVNKMLTTARKSLKAAGFAPYYLYRQKNTLGGLENVGFSKAGFEGLYNIYIMDETHTILAVGAGGVTKLKQPNGNRIERVFNFKYPYEYIRRFPEIINRKKKVKEFYANYSEDNRSS